MESGEIARVTVNYQISGGSLAQNVFHMQLGSGSVADSVALADLDNWVNAGWLGNWKTQASEDAEGIGFTADIMNVDGTVNRELGAASYSTHQGELVQDIEPAAVSYFMFAPTGLPKIRGRKFIPGVSEARPVDGLFGSGTLSALVTLAELFTNTYINGANSYVMGVLSTVLQEFVPFAQSYVISDVPAYQRRRKPGIGL